MQYNLLKDTWDDAQYIKKKTKYKIDSFSSENQDKFSVLSMKHHPGCFDLSKLLLGGKTEMQKRSELHKLLDENGAYHVEINQ